MAATASTLEAILNSLVAGFGKDAVQKACVAFTIHSSTKLEAPAPVAAASKKEKQKKVKKVTFSDDESDASSNSAPAAPVATIAAKKPSKWMAFVDEVLAEMRAIDASVTRKMAMAEAGRRQRASDPEAQKKYEEAKLKQAAKKAERAAARAAKKAAGEPVSSSSSENGSVSGSDEE